MEERRVIQTENGALFVPTDEQVEDIRDAVGSAKHYAKDIVEGYLAPEMVPHRVGLILENLNDVLGILQGTEQQEE